MRMFSACVISFIYSFLEVFDQIMSYAKRFTSKFMYKSIKKYDVCFFKMHNINKNDIYFENLEITDNVILLSDFVLEYNFENKKYASMVRCLN